MEGLKIITEGKILKEIMPMIIVLLLNFVLLFFSDEMVKIGEKNIPSLWYEMYHTPINDFYKPFKQSTFQIINLIFIFLTYSLGNRLRKNEICEEEFLIKIAKMGIIIQAFVIIFQKFKLDLFRPSGTLGNAQAIGTYVLSLLVVVIFSDKSKFKDIFYVIVSIFIVYVSEARSSIALLLILLIIRCLRLYKYSIILYLQLSINILFTVIFIKHEVITNYILKLVGEITSGYTLKMRFLMWESFYKTIENNPILGTMGRTVRFTENIIWYFLQPYGILGLVCFYIFLRYLIKNNNRVSYGLLSVMLIQGISYYGVFIPPLAYVYFLLLGYYSSRNTKGEVNASFNNNG